MSDKTIAEDPKKSPRVSLFGRNPGKPKGATPSAPEPPKRRRPRRSGLSYLSALLSFVLIGAVIGLGGFFAAYVEARKPGPLAADKVVVISREDDDGSMRTARARRRDRQRNAFLVDDFARRQPQRAEAGRICI